MKVIRIDIDVEFEKLSEIVDLVSASIRPILLDDGSYDEEALSEYQEFVVNVFAILDEHGFEVIDDHGSPYSPTSYYFTTYRKADSTSDNIKCIIFIRVSDHPVRPEADRGQIRYYSQLADRLKQPKSKIRQAWKLKNILVNRDKYGSYEEALKDIEHRIATLS